MAMTQEETEAAAVRGVDLTPEQIQKLRATLLNLDGKTSLAKRFRAMFALRGVGSPEAIQIISDAFQDHSALLGHELAYCLGQIGSSQALGQLESLVRDQKRHPMVRHEAAEAIGAISDLASVPFLKEYAVKDESIAVRETCEIALAKVEYDHGLRQRESSALSMYDSVDPAPALAMHETNAEAHLKGQSVEDLQKMLMDPSLPLFQRYRAMFTLRNIGDDPAVLALATGFKDTSALFRHEIAYIFGQLCSPASIPSLTEVLEDNKEDDMVRHEAAEALGSIATDDVMPIIKSWLTRDDSPQVVRESCQIALDMAEYERSGELDYAG